MIWNLGNKIISQGTIYYFIICLHAYLVEYCWNVLMLEPGQPYEDGVMITVMYLNNVRLKIFRDTGIRKFLKKHVKIMSDHSQRKTK